MSAVESALETVCSVLSTSLETHTHSHLNRRGGWGECVSKVKAKSTAYQASSLTALAALFSPSPLPQTLQGWPVCPLLSSFLGLRKASCNILLETIGLRLLEGEKHLVPAGLWLILCLLFRMDCVWRVAKGYEVSAGLPRGSLSSTLRLVISSLNEKGSLTLKHSL